MLLILYQFWCFIEDVKDYKARYFAFGIVIFIPKSIQNLIFFFLFNLVTWGFFSLETCIWWSVWKTFLNFDESFYSDAFFFSKPTRFSQNLADSSYNSDILLKSLVYRFWCSLRPFLEVFLHFKNIVSWVLEALITVNYNLITAIYSTQSLLWEKWKIDKCNFMWSHMHDVLKWWIHVE